MITHEVSLAQLGHWFQKEKRDFPWRRTPTPYRVWISEVMLQQTQSARVVLYFEEWMRRFPSVSDLAKATLEEVLKVWEGLGYYSRARALHEAAKFLLQEYDGQIPREVYELEQLKGLGPYTIAAIRAFGFHERTAAVDGNVMRVLTRLFEIQEDITKAKTQKMLRSLADRILPEKESWVYAEALIELGATFCKPKAPLCTLCPLQNQCQSYANKTQESLPLKTKKVQYETLFRKVLVIISGTHILLKKGIAGKVMADLYEFPYFDCGKERLDQRQMQKKISREFSLQAHFLQDLEEVKHSFTRFRVTLYPTVYHVPLSKDVPGYSWHALSDHALLTFSAGHKRILTQLLIHRGALSICSRL